MIDELFDSEFGRDLDTILNGTGDWTVVLVNVMNSFDGFPVRFIGLNVIYNVNSFNDENIVFHLDLTGRPGGKFSIPSVNLTRFQRASEGSGESSGRRGNNVVQRGSVRGFFGRINTVMFGNFRMNTECHRLILGR